MTMEPILTTSNPASLKAILGSAKGVLVFSGAGMSVEFGIPTYWTGENARYADERSEYGHTALEHASGLLWESHPFLQGKYHDQRLETMDTAFASHPDDNSYTLLRAFLEENNLPHFAVTSNVDGAFQHFGFNPDSVWEVHGSSRFSQCLMRPKEHGIFPTELDGSCMSCGSQTRPNTLFFDDFAFNSERETQQEDRYHDFLDRDLSSYVILEVGVGSTVPRVRDLATRLHYEEGLTYLHVNPTVDSGTNFAQLAALMGRKKKAGRPEAWITLGSREAFSHLQP
jgi:NAD-dependent SIR2 family protein deacetylase